MFTCTTDRENFHTQCIVCIVFVVASFLGPPHTQMKVVFLYLVSVIHFTNKILTVESSNMQLRSFQIIMIVILV